MAVVLYDEIVLVLLHWRSEFERNIPIHQIRSLEKKIADGLSYEPVRNKWLSEAEAWKSRLPANAYKEFTREYYNLIGD